MGMLKALTRVWGAGSEPAFKGADRRNSPRYACVPNYAMLAWQEGPEDVSEIVHVADVGVNGVLVTAARLPPSGIPVWIRLELPRVTEWYEAVVTRIVPPDGCALMFPGPCPYELYKATRGIREVEREHRRFNPEVDGRNWR